MTFANGGHGGKSAGLIDCMEGITVLSADVGWPWISGHMMACELSLTLCPQRNQCSAPFLGHLPALRK